MAEFTAQEAIRGRRNPAMKSLAIRRFIFLAVGMTFLAAVGRIALGWLEYQDQQLLRLLVVILPLAGGVAMAGTALIISISSHLGPILQRFGFLIFLGGVASLVILPWVFALAFRYVDSVAAAQTAEQLGVHSSFGGELTIGELQEHLLPADQREEALTAVEGRWSVLAWPLWLLQFRFVRDLILAFAALGFVATTASFLIWWERKVAGRIQSRLGPMRVGGWHGWAQCIADGLKLVQKEDIVPAGADRPLFKLAPYMVFIPVLAAFIALPFGAGWVFRDLDVALIFILSMVGIDVVGVILGGWASNNKWSVYGAMRQACQMVSYEVPMGMSLLIAVMTVGTLNLTTIAERQAAGMHAWLAFANPFTFIAGLTYFIAALASCKRAPFDLPEAESELVAGFHTEYSGFRWAVFMFGEYAAMLVVCGLATILFLGAWHSPVPASWGVALLDGPWWQRALHGLLFSGPVWFVAKAYGLLYVQIWMRWTLPRIRIDQVMYACVQVLLPLTMLLLLGNTFWQLLVPAGGLVARITTIALTGVGAAVLAAFVAMAAHGLIHRRKLVGTMVVDHLPGA